MTTSGDPLNQVRKAKTRKGKLVLQSREPQIIEGVKNVLFIRGRTASDRIMKLSKDLVSLKKPYFRALNRKTNDFLPFEDPSNIEFLTERNQAPLFVYTSHNKKRPDNLVMGRTYDGHILDMFEFGVENMKQIQEFKTTKISAGLKPVVVFAGDEFETQPTFIRMKNFFLDFFVGQDMDKIRLAGLENVISITVVEGKIYFRHYRIELMKSGVKSPRVELVEIGPRFNLMPRRNKIASDDLFKRSLKQPYQLKPKTDKNISTNPLGTTHGRIHMERQDFAKLNVKTARFGKRSADEVTGEADSTTAPPGMVQAMARLNAMNPTKKNRSK